MEIRNARKNEFVEIRKLVDSCFVDETKKGGIFRRWPIGYRVNHPENNFILKENNKMLSHIGYVPQDLIVDNVSVKIIGIGGIK